MDFKRALREELAQLRRRTQLVEQLLAAYGEDRPGSEEPADTPADPSPPPARKPPTRRSQNEPIVQAVRTYLSLYESGPVPTLTLYNHLVSQGIVIGGKEPRNTLSAIISNSGEFQAHGRSGWTLKPDAENEIAADANPGPGTSAALFEPRLTSEGTPPRGQDELRPGGGT